MDFTVANLGRIKSATFDIKPLTVFIGKTNTNKTWTAYALYGIVRSMTYFRRSHQSTIPEKVFPTCDQIDNVVDQVARRTADAIFKQAQPVGLEQGPTGTAPPSYTLELTRESIIREAKASDQAMVLSLNAERIARVLAVEQSAVDGAEATLTCEANFLLLNGKVKALQFAISPQAVMISATYYTGGTIQIHTFSRVSENLSADYIYEQIRSYVRWLAFAVFFDAIGFPAERKAMSAFFPVLEMARRDDNLRSLLNVPCVDFLAYLDAARLQQPLNRLGAIPKIVGLLERRVMNGRAEFLGPPDSRKFTYKGDSGPSLQIQASASLVRALAALDLYLRLNPLLDIIVVDEPEMNAHPEAQIELLEVFAMLANQGLRIIITTHSPYFIDHLNNLIEGATLSDEAKVRIGAALKLSDADAFISADKVSAYLFQEDGVVKNLLHDGVIDSESFANESDYVNNLYAQILQAKAGH